MYFLNSWISLFVITIIKLQATVYVKAHYFKKLSKLNNQRFISSRITWNCCSILILAALLKCNQYSLVICIIKNGYVPSLSKIKKVHHSASNLYTKKYVAIKSTVFASTTERLKAFEYAKEAQEEVNKLIEMEGSTPLSTEEQRRAAEEVWKYFRASIWNSTNSIRNMKLRADYINKISSNATK